MNTRFLKSRHGRRRAVQCCCYVDYGSDYDYYGDCVCFTLAMSLASTESAACRSGIMSSHKPGVTLTGTGPALRLGKAPLSLRVHIACTCSLSTDSMPYTRGWRVACVLRFPHVIRARQVAAGDAYVQRLCAVNGS